jgi:hypothetical protein
MCLKAPDAAGTGVIASGTSHEIRPNDVRR